jgi:hypothetical protein
MQMKKWVIAGVATLAVVGTGVGVGAYAQSKNENGAFENRFERMLERTQYGERGWRGRRMHRMSPEDRAAFFDARIAAVKAGLKLTPEQEKLWGPVETTVRELGKKWSERMVQRREERQKRRAERDGEARPDFNPIERIRMRAERLAERAADMKRFTDVAQPLYATLDDNQKRRLHTLVRGGRHHMMHRWQRWNDDNDRDRDDDRPRNRRDMPESEDRR